jgi:4-hydroxybenzoate polyprenyltransferase
MHSNWKHLRVPFQLTLAPIFLWGALLSGAPASARLALGFFTFHFLLYTGITAFNSYYDRDEGPIGGLERPPSPDPTLLPLALFLKAAGLVVAPLCGIAFTVLYLIFVALSFLYSHPSTRWKSSPLFSTLVVTLGQGMLGFLAGWAAARGDLAGIWTDAGTLGAASAALTTLGMYPITQIYQIDEDRGRGDRTLSVMLGPGGALRVSQAAFALGGIAGAALCVRQFGVPDAAIMGGAYLLIVGALELLLRRFARLDGRSAFRASMRMVYGGSAAFAVFILAEWLR